MHQIAPLGLGRHRFAASPLCKALGLGEYASMEENLNSDSIITLVGTVVTVIATGIAIWQALQAKNYSQQIKFDIRKINLSGCSEKLKRAQDDIRSLPTNCSNVPRGLRVKDLILNIKSQFDFSLSVIDSNGPDSDIRQVISNAQIKLNSYEQGWNNSNPKPEDVYELQSLIQDAISQSNSRIYQLEGKA